MVQTELALEIIMIITNAFPEMWVVEGIGKRRRKNNDDHNRVN